MRSDERGMTMVEVIVAVVVLIIGILALVGAFTDSKRLTLVSQRQDTMLHRARSELERLEAEGYPALLMNGSPTSSQVSGDQHNPDHYLAPGVQGTADTFQWDRTNSADTEPLAIDTTNAATDISYAPTPWVEGNMSGNVYDFVTWHTDAACQGTTGSTGSTGATGSTGTTASCPSSGYDYKRLTVEITQTSGGPPYYPVVLSTIIENPGSGGQDPLTAPGTTCQNGTPCVDQLDSGTVNAFFLHDTPASASNYTPPTQNHTLHPTVASPGGTCTPPSPIDGCAIPDLMDTNLPSGTTLYDYSTNLDPFDSVGGRAININSASCSGNPLSSPDNTTAEMWVSPVLSASSSTTLTGYGGITLYTQTVNGATANPTLCVGIYDVPSLYVSQTPPTLLGTPACFTPDSYPTSPAAMAFQLQPYCSGGNNGFLNGGTATIPAGDHIGVVLWVASGSPSGVAVMYDSASYESEVELNTK